MLHNEPSTIGEIMLTAIILFVVFLAIGVVRIITQPSAEAYLANRAEYRDNLIANRINI